jgi:iron(III) transport system ATP-binding protein
VIAVEDLRKSFATSGHAVAAVAGIGFEIKAGEMAILLGPSGCGKTTTLRCLAGLERPDSGRIAIGERTMADVAAGVFVPPQRRNLGMVFQSYAIWPHMTVLENVTYALEGRGLGKAERQKLALAALASVKLADFAERPAPRLSGGQQQRVAIARALVGRPQALLFDEPLSNLDAKLRIEMRNELRRIQRETGLTSIYVTHDQAEALAISDLIIVMKDGRIVESGPPVDVYRRPRHVFTAQFLGATNLIAGTVAGMDADLLAVTTALGRILGIDPTGTLRVGVKVMVSIRPEDLSPHAAAAHAVNTIEGHMTFAAFAGAAVEAELRCGDIRIQCLLDRDADLTLGRTVTLRAKPDACLVLPEE